MTVTPINYCSYILTQTEGISGARFSQQGIASQSLECKLLSYDLVGWVYRLSALLCMIFTRVRILVNLRIIRTVQVCIDT